MQIGETKTARGVEGRAFSLERAGRKIPAALWTPEAAEVKGIVLLGHGGTLDKYAPYLVSVARWLARLHGVASFAIDGPAHGERRTQSSAFRQEEFQAAWESPGTTDEMVADWLAALDDVEALLGERPLGYFGLSMGTMMGLPLCVAEPRIRAAVLGLMGTWGPNKAQLVAAAPKLEIPVRFLVQWDDEIVPRERCLALFDRLGSKQKSLRAHPGAHVAVPPDELRAVPAFLADRINAD